MSICNVSVTLSLSVPVSETVCRRVVEGDVICLVPVFHHAMDQMGRPICPRYTLEMNKNKGVAVSVPGTFDFLRTWSVEYASRH